MRSSKNYIAWCRAGSAASSDWKTDDVALQNIQARIRSPSVWLLANLRSSCSGDQQSLGSRRRLRDDGRRHQRRPVADRRHRQGVHAPLAALVRGSGPAGIGPLPELAAVNEQAPTAELRPPVLEADRRRRPDALRAARCVERAAIRDKHSPIEILQLMAADFPQYSQPQLAQWIERFFRLWCRNQWKRERYAPSFHLDDENLDPKTWCRFPILSGGYERELAELRKAAGR